ncbi:hypothetical protein R2571_005734 [Pseudomonas aeruginosa]|nr:hypothetical protein [Pseudomonas aeruginosa]
MSLQNTAIEDRLHAAGYKTERIGDVVNAHDPVHSAIPGTNQLEISHWKLVEVRTPAEAWAFIEARA